MSSNWSTDAKSRRRDAVSRMSATGSPGTASRRIASPRRSSGTEAAHLAAIAKDLEVDLIVAGAFGRSRLREWAFGGVTRDLLLKADRCTLVSH